MYRRRSALRILVAASVFTLVISIVGFATTLLLNTVVLDEFDAYGEVPIPGSGSVHLPAGEVKVSFRTGVVDQPSGGFPVPPLEMWVDPPAGVPEPEVTQAWGSTTTVTSDARVQVWTMQVPAEGSYQIFADGQVDGYPGPRLAFGHGSSYGWLLWLFAGLFAVSLVELAGVFFWRVRAGKA